MGGSSCRCCVVPEPTPCQSGYRRIGSSHYARPVSRSGAFPRPIHPHSCTVPGAVRMGRSGSDNRRRRSRRRAETVSVCATQPSRSNTHLFPATAPAITPSLFIALIIDQRSSVMSRADGNVTTVVQPTAAPPPRRSQLTPASGRSRRAQTDITDRNSTPVMDLFESEAFLLSKDLFLNHP